MVLSRIRSHTKRVKKSPSYKSKVKSRSRKRSVHKKRTPQGMNSRCMKRGYMGQCRGSTKSKTRCKCCASLERNRYGVCKSHKKIKKLIIY